MKLLIFMHKKQWLLLALILLIFSIISIFTVVTLTGISTPKVTVEIDAIQLTDEQVNMNISMQLDNQNAYDLELKDMGIKAVTSQNTVIGTITIPTTKIPAHETVTVYSEGSFGFNNEPLEKFESQINGDFGVKFFGIFSLSLPLNITIITNPTPVVDTVLLPSISLNADIERVNETGVLLNGSIIVDNQNEFSMSLTDTMIDIRHNATTINADIIVTDTVIDPQSTSSIQFTAFVGYEVLDIGKLTASLSGNVHISVAGIAMTRPFTASAEVNVPDLAKFLMDDERIVIALLADFDASITGLDMNVGFRVYNPTKIPLTASDLEIIVYRVDNETKSLLAEDVLENCLIPGKNETCLKTTFRLPLMSFLPIIGDGIPDWFLLTIRGDFIIADSNQKIPVQLNGYLNGNFFGSESLDINLS